MISCRGDMDNIRTGFERLEHFSPPPIRDFRIDLRVFNVDVTKMILHVLDALSGVQQMRGD